MPFTKRTASILALTALVGGIAAAGTALADGRSHGPMGGMMGGGERATMMFERFDQNADGKVTAVEIEAVQADRLQRFDTNGDGSLSLDEYQALWAEQMQERTVRSFQWLDADGNGQVTAVELDQPLRRMVTHMDRNGDGEIARDEIGRGHDRRGDRDDSPQN
jgi:Ca2+-binding EF-hand superfamily protein